MTRKKQTQTAEVAKKPTDNQTLIGSNILPADIEITEGQTVQLGEIVMGAHSRSGLSGEAWNALPEDERDSLLAREIELAKSAPAVAPPASETTKETASKRSQTPLEASSKRPAKAEGETEERVFKVQSRVKRNGSGHKEGDPITLDRTGFEELKGFRAVTGEFEDGTLVKD